MSRNGQVLTGFLVIILVFALVSIVGIGLVASKEISFSNFVKRAGDWFSSTISSLEYGLYSLNLQTAPVEQEITIPYFGEENLLPFFKAPFTITIYGEQVLPTSYEGYFGFRDLFYPISWIFRWFGIRKEGSLVKVEIMPGNIIELSGYYYLDNEIFPNYEHSTTTALNDGSLATYVLIGDNPGTPDIEDYYITFLMPATKYVDYLSLYAQSISPASRIVVLYWNDLNQRFDEIASTTIAGQFVYLPIKKNTNTIRIIRMSNVLNDYALISEARFYGN